MIQCSLRITSSTYVLGNLRGSQSVYILCSKHITVIFKSKLATAWHEGSDSLIFCRNRRKKLVLFKCCFVEIYEKREMATRIFNSAYRNKH